MSHKPLSPNTRVRVLVNGIGCYCRVKDICSAEILEVVELINAERRKGNPTVGIAHGRVQVNLEKYP